MQCILPIRTVSEQNVREHWRARSRRARAQRYETFTRLALGWPRRPPLPLTITLTRIAPRALDADAVPGSMKHVTDGVSDWLAGAYQGGQDRLMGLTWQYAQRRGAVREYGVEIFIASH